MSDRNDGWIILIVIVLIILFAGPMMFMGGWFMGPRMMGGYGYGYGYGSSWLGVIFRTVVFLVFLGLIALGVYYFLGVSRARPSSRALEILKERYARGEIRKEEYDRMKQELSKEN